MISGPKNLLRYLTLEKTKIYPSPLFLNKKGKMFAYFLKNFFSFEFLSGSLSFSTWWGNTREYMPYLWVKKWKTTMWKTVLIFSFDFCVLATLSYSTIQYSNLQVFHAILDRMLVNKTSYFWFPCPSQHAPTNWIRDAAMYCYLKSSAW